jgi:hypothetical protein
MNHQELFQATKAAIPRYGALAAQALSEVLAGKPATPAWIKAHFSSLVETAQARAYELYMDHERAACSDAIRAVLHKSITPSTSVKELVETVAGSTVELDRWFLSMTQSRRPRAGKTFEAVVTHLFKALNYPHSPQPDLGGDRPDYVLPSIEYYRRYASDCIIFTCKRTLRERWRQVVTEGVAAQFFLATIDDKISRNDLDMMRARRVVVVVPAAIRVAKYEAFPNVVSFEEFFERHLDPAIARWKSAKAI